MNIDVAFEVGQVGLLRYLIVSQPFKIKFY